jgi:integrase
MRGSVSHRHQPGKPGSWSYRVDVGDSPAQRCPACAAAKQRPHRWWLARRPLAACPNCRGPLIDSTERCERIVSGFRTKREAQAALNAAISALRGDADVEPSKLTVKQYLLSEWLPALESTLRPATIASYRGAVENYVVPALGSIPLQKLSATQIEALYAALLREPRGGREGARPLAASTVHQVHVVLHRALRDAVRQGRRTGNPCDAATPPRRVQASEAGLHVWTADQLGAFLAVTRKTRLGSLWQVLALTGMRRGEALGLRWEDVDLEAARLSIQRSLVPVHGKVVVSEPKTAKGRRSIALDAGTVVVLRKQAARQLADQDSAGKAYRTTGYVFSDELGQALDPGRVSKCFNVAVEVALLPRITLHCLRHTHATLGLAAGVHPKVMQERLGHANIGITLDLYSHSVRGMDESAAELIAALVSSGSDGREAS